MQTLWVCEDQKWILLFFFTPGNNCTDLWDNKNNMIIFKNNTGKCIKQVRFPQSSPLRPLYQEEWGTWF